MKTRHTVCPVEELPPGETVIVEVDGFSVGVFNVDGEFHALKNDCPHQRAPLCEGRLTGTTTADGAGEYEWERPGEIIRCPWHGWEFDVTTGESIFNPHEVKAKGYEADVETEEVACDGCETELEGEEPPVETFDVETEEDATTEEEVVVVYV
jgi:nitrite reductase/ring-hydroxylating ferredoxin subunit